MNRFRSLLLPALFLLACACSPKATKMPADALALRSPDTQLELKFAVVNGVPTYTLDRAGTAVILPSRLGFELIGRDNLDQGFTLTGSSFDSFDETWEPVWGEEAQIRNHYNELLVNLKKETGETMNIRFRLYDDGLGFRYEFPMENKLTYFKVQEELTEFALAGDHTAWWISGDYDTQEYNYTESRISEIPRINSAPRPYNASQTDISNRGVQTALQLKTDSGLYINLHEARVLDYPTANLVLEENALTFQIHLTPDAEGVKGRLQAPCVSPWRTVQVCTSATAVLASRLILNLNDPCVLDDVSWIHPTKYMGVWWEMITGKTHWSYTSDYPSVQLGVTDYAHAKPHGHHGANNENVRRYLDFAAENGFDALLIEGWNEGWEDWFGAQKDFVFDFLTPYPDFDLPGLNAYAHSKGMRLIMHHETSSSTVNYERWMEKAYNLMNQYGYDAVKSGYVQPAAHQPLSLRRRESGQAPYHGQRARGGAPHRPVPHLAQHDRERERDGQRVHGQRQSRPYHHPALHAPAGRPDGLYARHLRTGHVHHRTRTGGQDAPHPLQPAGPLRDLLQSAPDGCRPAGELRPLHGCLPVHQGRGRGLGQEPLSGG